MSTIARYILLVGMMVTACKMRDSSETKKIGDENTPQIYSLVGRSNRVISPQLKLLLQAANNNSPVCFDYAKGPSGTGYVLIDCGKKTGTSTVKSDIALYIANIYSSAPGAGELFCAQGNLNGKKGWYEIGTANEDSTVESLCNNKYINVCNLTFRGHSPQLKILREIPNSRCAELP